MQTIRQFATIKVSYLSAAPDHKRPEVAVIYPNRRRGSVVPVAVGERAQALWASDLDEAAWKALAEAAQGAQAG